jgi:hypothetical protein
MGEKMNFCMNLEFVSAGLIIINNWINPTQTHYTLQVAVDIWVLCLQLKKSQFTFNNFVSLGTFSSCELFLLAASKKIPKLSMTSDDEI